MRAEDSDLLLVLLTTIFASALFLWVLGRRAGAIARRMAKRLERVVDPARRRRLMRCGLPATAEVIAAQDTGSRFERFMLARLRLRVTAVPGTPPFEAEAFVPLKHDGLARFPVGRSINVHVDPDTREVALDDATA